MYQTLAVFLFSIHVARANPMNAWGKGEENKTISSSPLSVLLGIISALTHQPPRAIGAQWLAHTHTELIHSHSRCEKIIRPLKCRKARSSRLVWRPLSQETTLTFPSWHTGLARAGQYRLLGDHNKRLEDGGGIRPVSCQVANCTALIRLARTTCSR